MTQLRTHKPAMFQNNLSILQSHAHKQETAKPTAPATRAQVIDSTIAAVTAKKNSLYRVQMTAELSQQSADESARLENQLHCLYALLGVFNVPTPDEELTALAAIVEHYPQGAKTAQAGRLWRETGNTLTFEVPSSKAPHAPYLVTHNAASGVTVCNCAATTKECWHIRVVNRLTALHSTGEADLTPAPMPAKPAPAIDYCAYFESVNA